MKMKKYIAASFFSLSLLGCSAAMKSAEATPAALAPLTMSADFVKHWYDGKAELAGYDLVSSRYGQLRKGVAVSIYVTETFANSARVKSDGGRAKSDEFRVMKLNLMEDFQTGIYDYNLMSSVFVSLNSVNNRPAGTPTKVVFSGQEWCGTLFHMLLFDAANIRETLHSYFDGEGDQDNVVEYPANGISEDVLPLWARQMAAPMLAPGESVEVPMLSSLRTVRFYHFPVGWGKAKLTREMESQSITVPAGTFEVEVWRAEISSDISKSGYAHMAKEIAGGLTKTFYVEKASPNRIIKWETNTGDKAELLASDRLKYWELNGEGEESLLSKIGLSRRPPKTP
jgi:hypothetical protein